MNAAETSESDPLVTSAAVEASISTTTPHAPVGPHARRHVPLAACMVALFVLAVLALPAARPAVWSRLHRELSLSFTRIPATYSTLSIPNNYRVAKVVPGQPVPVSFAISNHELSTTTYRFVVVLRAGASTATRTGQVTIGRGRSVAVRTDVTASTVGSQYLLEIFLPSQHESVHLRLHDSGAGLRS